MHCSKFALGDLDQVLLTDEADDLIDSHGKEEAKQHAQKILHTREETIRLDNAVKTNMGEVMERVTKRRKGAPMKDLPPNDDQFTQDAVSALLPPHARIYKGYFNGRWLLWYRSSIGARVGPWKSKSKSWGPIGNRAVVLELLRFGWDLAEA